METIKIISNKEIITNFNFLHELKITIFNGSLQKIYIFNKNKVISSISPIKMDPYILKNLNIPLKNCSIVVETKEYSNIPCIVNITGTVSNWELVGN